MTTKEEILEARRAEVTQYEANIAMYNAILSTLPDAWPAEFEYLRGVANRHAAAAEIEDLNLVAMLSQLWYADECRAAIRAEMVEMTKAKAILAVLEAGA
jgi:hypothetical protein